MLLKKIKACYEISRPLNVSITFFSILIAASLSPAFKFSVAVWLAAVSAALITAGANIINDIFDIEIDRINKPRRPLPSGRLSIKTARIFFIASYLMALALSWYCGWIMFAIALIFSVLLYFYSSQFKRTILTGNLLVSLASAFAFIYGALAVNDWKSGVFPAIFAFLFHFGREVIKDLQDVEGDLAQHAVTFAGKYGPRASIFLINLVFMLLILLTFVPYIFGAYGIGYMTTVGIGVDLALVTVLIILWRRRDPRMLGYISHVLKLDMFVGLLAIYMGTHHVIFFN
jgi:geranylgeranylglycerol-phosphate geranylgeranyltransferase